MKAAKVMESLEERPPRKEPWLRWALLALVLSLAAHLGFVWWAQRYPVKIFSDTFYDQIVPRAFKVDRVEIDSRLLDDELKEESKRDIFPAPVELPPEDITAEKPAASDKPAKPAELDLKAEPVPQLGASATESADHLTGSNTAALDEDLNSMREALLAEQPASAAQPAIDLAPAGSGAAGGDSAIPAGYSDLDDLLMRTGALSVSTAPIFMPSDLLFSYDQSSLGPEAVSSLEKLGELIRRNPDARFRIEGHTDSFGGTDYNARLSLARAASVKDWLVQNMSIDPARIDTRGLGNIRPLAPTTGSIEEQKLNRRVEIVILRAAGGR
jgi:outer membrane protein OmpA-like peptidoglycan-associated protein